jgi:hypothetical protein
MEPDDSLSRSQEPATGLYPDLDEYSPHHSILFLFRPILLLSSTYV